MDEKEVVQGGLRVWQAVTGLGLTVVGLVYWTGRKESKFKGDIEELQRNVHALQNAQYITKPHHDNLQQICQQSLKLTNAEALHKLDNRMQGIEITLTGIKELIESTRQTG